MMMINRKYSLYYFQPHFSTAMFATTARTHYPPCATWQPVQIPPMCPASPPLPPSRSSRVSSFLLFIGTITIIINCIIPVPIPIITLDNSEQFTSKISSSSFSSPSSPSQSSREREGERAVQNKISQSCEIVAKTSGTGQKNAQMKIT